jgi:hypothetical protein
MRQGSHGDLDSDIELFTVVEKRSGWLRGLLVARRVNPEKSSIHPERPNDGFTRISAAEFARRTGTARERVVAMWNAWERAANDGIVPHAEDLTPEMEVDIPDEGEVPWFGENGYYRSYEARMQGSDRRKALEEESERAGIKPTDPIYVAHRTKAMQVAILADPKVREAAEDALGEVRRRETEATAVSESKKAQEYIRQAQDRMGKNPVADLDRADEERQFTDRLIRLKLEMDSVLRTMQGRSTSFTDHTSHLIQVTCAHIRTSADWIDTLAKPGQKIDDRELEVFLASEGGKK